MQKTSFQGLKHVFVCADERFRRLQRILSSVENTAVFLVEELFNYMLSEKLVFSNQDFIRHILKTKSDFFKSKLQERLEKTFIELHFHIVFLELTSILTEYISNEVETSFQELQSSYTVNL